MRQEKSILILTSHFGEGHIQTAQTIANEFRAKGYSQVHVCDLYGEAYPAIHSLAQNLLKKGFSKFGAPFYKAFYYGTDKLSSRGLSYFYQHLGKKRLMELANVYHPSLIITTFPLHAGPYLRSTLTIPTYTIITDYCAHPLWVHPKIEKYYVASEYVKNTLISYGVNDHQILVSGIPIRSNFQHLQPNTKHEFNLNKNKKTVTIMGGGLGLIPNLEPLLNSLSQNKKIQVAVVCGKNNVLRKHLNECATNWNKNIVILGYVPKIEKLLSMTDCLVTKSGALSLTEAASLKLPIILFKPTPGQELENANYFLQQSAALTYKNKEELLDNINKCLFDEKIRNRLSNQIYSLYNKHACPSIAVDILTHQKGNKTIRKRRV
ncbi:MGDG synthase family glycosyltransferase [Rossellomorea aquimaris]|uniref:MGDG synthase family glycosyltransferase n=1 Tax=Rossellomorea aquimaris TaxID=189382 RepID=UPI0007D0B26B|nr:glycosyltransferase [Rossellomorea aquimaris]